MNDRLHYSCAVIVAAGSSTRMKSNMNKNYMEIGHTYAVSLTLQAFDQCESIDEIIYVHKKGEVEEARSAVADACIAKPVIYAQGGATRQESVYNGLKAAPNKTTHVAIHDGARVLITPEAIEKTLQKAYETGAATLAAKPADTCAFAISEAGEIFISEFADREKLLLIQTPQCFEYELILKAHEKAMEEHFPATDDTSVAYYAGHKISIVINDKENIKVTKPEDLYTAKSILTLRKNAETKEG